MAIRFLEGFDNYGHFAANTSTFDANQSITTGLARNFNTVAGSWIAKSGRFNGNSAAITPGKNPGQLKKAISATGVTSFIVGFNLRFGLTDTSLHIILSNNTISTTQGLRILFSGSNYIFQLNGANVYTVALSTLTSTWNHIELLIPLSPSAENPIRFYLNGTERGTSSTSMFYDGTFTLYVSGNSEYQIDDYYVLDNTGTTNNTKIGTELYIPRIEMLSPVSDDTVNFTNSNGTVLSTSFDSPFTDPHEFLIPLGCTNISYLNETSFNFRYISRSTSNFRTSPACLIMSNTTVWMEFTTDAVSLSFWAKSSSSTSTLPVVINGTTNNCSLTTTYEQFTFTLTPQSLIRIGPFSGAPVCIDDLSLDYTGTLSARDMSQTHSSMTKFIASSTTNDVAQFDMSNLSTINDVKGVQFNTLFAESQSGVTATAKFVLNGNEVGSNKTVTGILTSTTPYNTEVFDLNPETSSAWTVSAVNAIKSGIKNKSLAELPPPEGL